MSCMDWALQALDDSLKIYLAHHITLKESKTFWIFMIASNVTQLECQTLLKSRPSKGQFLGATWKCYQEAIQLYRHNGRQSVYLYTIKVGGIEFVLCTIDTNPAFISFTDT